MFSKVPEFLLVACKLLEIHWAAFFFAVLRFVFEKKRMQKTQEVSKTWVFCIRFFSKTKRKTAKINAAQCISSNLKATSKNSGTFENTHKKVDFPLSIVFDQALQLSFSFSLCVDIQYIQNMIVLP